ncbi:MAG: hypothetical protein Q4D89_03815 [Arachnia propionica]|nr:hypothetical protein [Arachnia propionica]
MTPATFFVARAALRALTTPGAGSVLTALAGEIALGALIEAVELIWKET